MKSFASYSTNASHLSFHDTPEAFDVVGVDIPPDVLVPLVVYVLVDVTEFRETTIHLETIGIDFGFRNNTLMDGLENVSNIELPGLDVDEDFSRGTAKQADNRELVRSMTTFAFEASNVEFLVLPLPSDVGLVHLDDADEWTWNH